MTTTHDTPAQSHHAAPAGARPAPVDPEHDIDAKSTALWVLGSTVVLFVSLYFMLPLFDRILMIERGKKIDNLAPVELEDTLEVERAFLNGSNESGKTIEQVMRERAVR